MLYPWNSVTVLQTIRACRVKNALLDFTELKVDPSEGTAYLASATDMLILAIKSPESVLYVALISLLLLLNDVGHV